MPLSPGDWESTNLPSVPLSAPSKKEEMRACQRITKKLGGGGKGGRDDNSSNSHNPGRKQRQQRRPITHQSRTGVLAVVGPLDARRVAAGDEEGGASVAPRLCLVDHVTRAGVGHRPREDANHRILLGQHALAVGRRGKSVRGGGGGEGGVWGWDY